MPDPVEFLVVGLGNPGEEYESTPHNLGFLVIDRLAEAHAIRVSRKENLALVGLGSIGKQRVALAKPQTYMNLSGQSVEGLLERYELNAGRLVVVYDELDLPWGSLRIRPSGSAAGHKGMKSVIAHVGTQNIARVRVGVDLSWKLGREGGRGADYLLSKLKRSEKQEVEEMAGRAAAAVESILAEGVHKAMAIHNRRAQGSNEEEE
jgi:peptidyl-tRNA hydrolase, PTH1 family